MITVNAMGDACPIPVVKTKQAIAQLHGAGTIEILVDNEIAVQNLTKMANQKGYAVSSEQTDAHAYRVIMQVEGEEMQENSTETYVACQPAQKNVVVAIGSAEMGSGSEELGKILIKGFLYALTQQDELPASILFYNGGAALTCEGSDSLEDLKTLSEHGVEILTCGTCLNHYGLHDKLMIGEVTNMYVIAEKMMNASSVVKP